MSRPAPIRSSRATAARLRGFSKQFGIELLRSKQPEAALLHLREAIRLRPDFAEAQINIANALHALGRLEEALSYCRQACSNGLILRMPTTTLAASCKPGQLDEAMTYYEKTLQLEPDHAEAHWNRSLLRLLHGDFKGGWPEYEWRLAAAGLYFRHQSRPRWQGEPFVGQTILLHAEQGLGDTVQFVRYASLVKQAAAG